MIKILGSPTAFRISDTHNYYGGSVGNAIFNLFYFLSKFDLEFHAIVRKPNFTNPVLDNLKIYGIGEGKIVPFFKLIRQANKILKKEKIDVITHLYFTYGVRFNPLFSKIKDYPFVIGMAESSHLRFKDEMNGMLDYPGIKDIGKKAVFPLFKKTLEYCDALIVVDKGTKNLYSDYIPAKKIRIVPHGVNLNEFSFSALPKNHNILAVGNLTKRKGFDYLIGAMPAILKEYPDTHLNIIGEGPRKEILQRLARNLGVEEGLNLFFHDRVSFERLLEWYRSCEVLCHPSLSEGFCHPVVEVMATGRPVICTNTNGSEMVENNINGFFVQTANSEEIANAILKLFSDEELACKMGSEGRKKVEKEYDWSKIGEKYYRVFEEVAN